MKLKSKVNEFISNSSKFHRDCDLENIDSKHSTIIGAGYENISAIAGGENVNFRNWEKQGDMSAPFQFSLTSISQNGLARSILNVGRKFLYPRRDKYFKQSFFDDLCVIENIGGLSKCLENPVHKTPGAGISYFFRGTSANLRWLRYIYILQRMENETLLHSDNIWVDIGSYYGGLQGLVKKYFPDVRIVMIDFQHQLCRSFLYLSQLFPEAEHVLPDQLSNYSSFHNLPKGCFAYLPVSNFNEFAGESVDLVSNFFSFGEMKREYFNTYMNSKLLSESNRTFLVNRFISAPFFEKTYDSDLTIMDYDTPSRNNIYFDVFPMHHFLLTERQVLSNYGLRNTGSAYFELITAQ